MELRQLEYFVAVVEEANFTRAAERLHVAQPGISTQVRRLERELGLPLLDRSDRTVRLTEAGAAVLPYARATMAAVSGAREAVDELTGLVRGHVTIGTVTSINSDEVDLAGLLSDFHADHPDVEISLTVSDSESMVEALRAGRLDVAFVGLGTVDPPGVRIHVVTEDALVAVVGHADPLADETEIPLATLADRTLIALPWGAGLRTCVEEACAAAGFRPRIAFEAGDPRVVARLAARGLGVAIVPRSVADARRAELHTLTLTHPDPRGRMVLAWRAEEPIAPAARALIDHARVALATRAKAVATE